MEKGGKTMKVKKPNEVSSSGREIKRPKHLVTTSSDESSNPKRSKVSTNLQDRIKQLKGMLAGIETKKIAEKSLLDVSAKSNLDEIPHQSVLRPQTSEKMPIRSACSHVLYLEESLEKSNSENSIPQPSTSGTAMKPVVKEMIILKETEKINKCTDSSDFHAVLLPVYLNVIPKVSKPSKMPVSTTATSTKREIPGNDSESRSVLGEDDMEAGDQADQTEETFGTATSTDLSRICELFETIKKQNMKIIKQNSLIISRLPDISSEDNLEKSLYEPLNGFPISTMEEFDNLNAKNKTDLRKRLYKHLLYLGGSTVRNFLYAGLKMIMTDNLVDKFNWQKSEKKREFGNTRVSNVLFQAAKDCPLFKGPHTKAQYKVEMVDYVLRATKQRHRNSLKKPYDAESVREEIRRLNEMLGDADVDSSDDTRAEEEEAEEDEELADDELE